MADNDEGKRTTENDRRISEDGKRIAEDGRRIVEDGKRIVEDGERIAEDADRTKWRHDVDGRLNDGAVQLEDLQKGQNSLLLELKKNTEATQATADATTANGLRLDAHIINYGAFTQKVQPAIDAIETMKSGVKAIGKIGDGLSWTARWIRKTAVFIGPIFTLGLAIWAFTHDRTSEVWRFLLGLVK